MNTPSAKAIEEGQAPASVFPHLTCRVVHLVPVNGPNPEALMVSFMLTSFFIVLFCARGVSGWWTTEPMLEGTQYILDPPTLLTAYAAINIALDIAVLILPLTVIKSLHISLGERWAIAGVFLLGAFCLGSMTSPSNRRCNTQPETSFGLAWKCRYSVSLGSRNDISKYNQTNSPSQESRNKGDMSCYELYTQGASAEVETAPRRQRADEGSVRSDIILVQKTFD
ncbi:hypothetical protein B0J11DRAFT_500933 [Dendryphion nanum]|uniref:Rhodopsin domain-containing protein n=1 Tax=Dendryphion nanum TaxID=256645 RepID=A0A9P9EKU5_9PLEO|nr:hypothetical protein B0J11DRAFT_500933 [Dendryphion nanum]